MSVPSKKAPLPANYVQAKNAVAECARIDECKDWTDKAVALAAYARQMKDTKLLDDARRIQDRAIRRGGELLQQVKAAKPGPKVKGTTVPTTRSAAANGAGLSPAQAKQMVRVANVPKGQFEALVEGPRPPTPKQLAEIGTKKQERAKPEPYRNEWIDWTIAVKALASLPACGLDVLAKRNPLERQRLQDDAKRALANLKLWYSELQGVE
jgi:hypothetical protein